VIAQATDGFIIVEGACGTIPISSGEASASFISQNTPNPFGGSASATNLPFDIGADGTVVTISILNATGEEVLKPVDHVAYARGRYTVTVRSQDLGSGAYFYRFQVDGMKPQVKKMVVE